MASPSFDGMTPSVSSLFLAILRLAMHEGVRRCGEEFSTRRAALIVESQLKPITCDCALWILERDGWIKRDGKPGKGTSITVLKLPDRRQAA